MALITHLLKSSMIEVANRSFLWLEIFVSLLRAVALDGSQALVLSLRVPAIIESSLEVHDCITLFVISAFVDLDLPQLGQCFVKGLLVRFIQVSGPELIVIVGVAAHLFSWTINIWIALLEFTGCRRDFR